jgi:hypothetical protein
MSILLAAALSWRILQPGVEFAEIKSLYVVRVDPERANVQAALASETNQAPQTAAAWCRQSNLAVAINAGMFQTDQRSNVGYLRHGKHRNNSRWNNYRSAVGIKPKEHPLWLDLDQTQSKAGLEKYDVVVQNLRLIAGDRKNVWVQSARQWSEAALAVDSRGRLLLLFSRAPYSMKDFNAMILGLPLDVRQAMHLEGGPEASLSIHVPGLDLDLSGSYETGFSENDANQWQWPIPNVLGVKRDRE